MSLEAPDIRLSGPWALVGSKDDFAAGMVIPMDVL